MKKILAIVLAIAMVATLTAGVAFAGNGNGAPPGQHYNLNIIGVPNVKNANYSGGQGSVIFVSRTGSTMFYVNGGSSYEILDHDGTDGKVGTSITDPGIVFPYDPVSGTWQVAIYVRLLGPQGSQANWTSWYYDSTGSIWVLYASFSLTKNTKFQLKTSSLLATGYQNMLWQLDPVTKYRICQMRIYLD